MVQAFSKIGFAGLTRLLSTVPYHYRYRYCRRHRNVRWRGTGAIEGMMPDMYVIISLCKQGAILVPTCGEAVSAGKAGRSGAGPVDGMTPETACFHNKVIIAGGALLSMVFGSLFPLTLMMRGGKGQDRQRAWGPEKVTFII